MRNKVAEKTEINNHHVKVRLKIFLVAINPLDVLRWTFRRNERDVVKLYDALAPIMQVTTGGSMLNFGYWDDAHRDPASAQKNLCRHVAVMADMEHARIVVDVGSGLSAPASYWKEEYRNVQVCCVNINYSQLRHGVRKNLTHVNASSARLPFRDRTVDRIIALESAQHFKPFSDFIAHAKRILLDSGLLVLAIPVTTSRQSDMKMGILKFTWSSEHYSLGQIREFVEAGGFAVDEESFVGRSIYGPLAEYYIKNRSTLREKILQQYPSYVETILFKSIQKMKKASDEGIIDYVLLKCKLKNA